MPGLDILSEEDYVIYSSESDIFSYGMVLCEIFSGKYPYANFNDTEVKIKYLKWFSLNFTLKKKLD